MSDKSTKRNRRLYVRLTDQEFEKINHRFQRTTCQTISEYLRKILLDKTIQVKHRNQSLDDLMAELIRLRVELNALGNNYNQVVKRLHAFRDAPALMAWLPLHESARKILFDKVSDIKSKINQINDRWLQE